MASQQGAFNTLQNLLELLIICRLLRERLVQLLVHRLGIREEAQDDAQAAAIDEKQLLFFNQIHVSTFYARQRIHPHS